MLMEREKKHKLTPEMEKMKWKKGQSPNPAGRPKGTGLKDLLLAEIKKINHDDKLKRTWGELVVSATIRLAIAGNSAALKEVWERIEGRVAQPITGNNGGPIEFNDLTKDAKSALSQKLIAIINRGRDQTSNTGA